MYFFKFIITIILFYFLAIIQNSFFAHFNFLGSFPNFILIFFLLLIFFEKEKNNYILFFNSLIAGLFLDIFYETYFGISVLILIIIGFSIKKIQLSLQEKEDKYPFGYFLFLFLSSFIIYQIIFILYSHLTNPLYLKLTINYKKIFDILYNIVFAIIGFYVFKKITNINNNKQLKLFK